MPAGLRAVQRRHRRGVVLALPALVPGLQAWFRAKSITGLGDGASIPTWTDISGNGHDLTQSTGSAQPTYKTDLGFPTVRFDGGDYLEQLSFTLAHPFTLFVTAIATNKTTLRWAGGTKSGLTHGVGVCVVLTTGLARLTCGLNLTATGGDWSAGWGVTSAIGNGASSEIWFNGGNHAANDAGSNTFIDLRIGDFAGQAKWLGDIASMAIYTGSMATANRTALQTYFGAEVGLTI